MEMWYDTPVAIRYFEFVRGKEELLVVNDRGCARIFSLVMQKFK